MQQCELRVEVKTGKAVFITVSLRMVLSLIVVEQSKLGTQRHRCSSCLAAAGRAGRNFWFRSDIRRESDPKEPELCGIIQLRHRLGARMTLPVLITVASAGVHVAWLQVADGH